MTERDLPEGVKRDTPAGHVTDNKFDPKTGEERIVVTFSTSGPEALYGSTVVFIGDSERNGFFGAYSGNPDKDGIREIPPRQLSTVELRALADFAAQDPQSESLSRIRESALEKLGYIKP